MKKENMTWKEAFSLNPAEIKMSFKDYMFLMSKALTNVESKKELKANICDYFTDYVKPIIDRNLDSKHFILNIEIGKLCDLYGIAMEFYKLDNKFRGFDILRETKHIVNKIFKTNF